MSAPQEPWQWPEEHWRGLVNRVRAGRSLKPRQWPQGARCAVALSFDSDHETNELREGGVFQLTLHPHISGYRSRIWILDELIRYMRSNAGVWFATHADIARYAKANAG